MSRFSRPYNNQIAEGFSTGTSVFRQLGHNDTIGATWETLWELSTPYLYMAAGGEKVTISSNSGQDGPAGTGALTVYVSGLDADYNEISEIMTMSGAALVTSTNTYLRILNALVIATGANGTNVGNITIANTLATMTLAYIVVGEGSSNIPVFTVPDGKTATLLRWCYGEAGDLATTIALWSRPARQAWSIRDEKIIKFATFETVYAIPIVFEARTDIEVRGNTISTNGIAHTLIEGYYR